MTRTSSRAVAVVPLALLLAGAVLLPARAASEGVPVRIREATAHGFLVVSRVDGGAPAAHGELVQTERGRMVDSRLRFWWTDGSFYDERVLFSQNGVFRIEHYRLVQRGPSFREDLSAAFERSGAYRARVRSRNGDVDSDAGRFAFPPDVGNGLTSVLLKNLRPGEAVTTHLAHFSPKPRVLDLHLEAEEVDPFAVGSQRRSARRWEVRPRVGGVTGLFASVIGKQPPDLSFWIVTGDAPTMIRFEGALEMDGTRWRVELDTPRWPRS